VRDPDTKREAVRVEVDANATSKEAQRALYKMLHSLSGDGRLARMKSWYETERQNVEKKHYPELQEMGRLLEGPQRNQELILAELAACREGYEYRRLTIKAREPRSNGGKATAEARQLANTYRDKRIRDAYANMTQPERERAGILVRRFSLSAKQIRRIIKKK
jgi:hypothetical protein